MSFMDKLKSWFSGGSESTAAHEPADLPTDTPMDMPATTPEAAEPADLPPAPVDPLGTPMPGTGTATLPPTTGDEPDERA
jgi:hypothetical protein